MMERTKQILLSTFGFSSARSTCHQTNTSNQAEPTAPPQILQTTKLPCANQVGSEKSDIASFPYSNSPRRLDTLLRSFPAELPPRPPEKRPKLLRKRKAPTLNISAAPSCNISPSHSSGSLEATDLTRAIYCHTLDEITPPLTPTSPSVSIESSTESSSFDTLKSSNRAPIIPKSVEQDLNISGRQLMREPVPSQTNPDVNCFPSDPLAERFERLKSEHFSPKAPVTAISHPPHRLRKNSEAPDHHFECHMDQENLGVMASSPMVRRGAIRKRLGPSRGPLQENAIQTPNEVNTVSCNLPRLFPYPTEQPHMSQHNNKISNSSPSTAAPQSQLEYDSIDPCSSDNQHASNGVEYPDLEAVLERTRGPTQLPKPMSYLKRIDQRVTAEQEARDRKMAEELQEEEYVELLSSLSGYDDAFIDEHGNWLLEELRSAAGLRTSPNRVRLSRDIPRTFLTGSDQASANRGTLDDPIEIDSNSDNEMMEISNQQQDNTTSPRDQIMIDEDTSEAEVFVLAQEAPRGDSRVALREVFFNDLFQPQMTGTRECAVCGDPTMMVDLPSLANCTHQPETCSTCFAAWIASELDKKGWKNIKCPGSECRVILEHHEVQQYATKAVFDQYDTFSMRAALSDDPNFRWCTAPGCTSGQIHMSGEEGNIFTCVACLYRVCIIHGVAWHEGETCEEYTYRVNGQKEKDQRAQEEASVQAIGQLSKKCPGPKCIYNIQKNDGCDHMTCESWPFTPITFVARANPILGSSCRFEFCWVCLADYSKIRKKGNSAHEKTCKYHSSMLN